jgi:hypothetical protein
MKYLLLFAYSLIVFRAFSWNPEPFALELTADTIYGSTILCEDSDSIIYSTDSIGGAASYNWSVPSGWTIISGDGTTSILVDPGTAGENGVISVSATDTSGSSAAFSMYVSVNPLPEVFAGEDTALCSGSFPYTLVGSGNAASYNWPGNPPSLTMPAWGICILIGTLNGCTNSDTVTIHIAFCGGLDESGTTFTVYPNPASETISVMDLFLQEKTDYRIYGSDGRLAGSGTVSDANPIIAVDVIEPGSYFIRIGTATIPFKVMR